MNTRTTARMELPTRTVEPTDKSFPLALVRCDVTDLHVPLADFSTPLMVIDADALARNLGVMDAWSRAHGMELMPHGKTTMSPVLWHRQLEAGATGITVATGWQADLALRAGVPTVQIANTCLDPALLRRLTAQLAEHPDQELVCWADSPATIGLMEAALAQRAGGGPSRIGILAELGSAGARTGARTDEEVLAVARRAADSSVLELRGVAGYEGALAHSRSEDSLRAVRDYCDRLAGLVEPMRPLVTGEPWISAGGSAFPDQVAEACAGVEGARRILRSGAYVVHDQGFYHGISPLEDGARGLQPAMHAYARVVSTPEPGLALLDAGKRDLPFDEGLPVALAVAPALGGQERPLHAEVTALNDQHAFLRWEGTAPVALGEVVRLGISHPCTAFDKWRLIPVVDPGSGIVREALETLF